MRKALEAPLALWIDLVLPKRLVLEIYLNIAEWGPNGEFGVEAGARRAFNKRTNNAERLHDPEYLGRRHERVIGQAYFAFVDQFVTAVKQELPRTVCNGKTLRLRTPGPSSSVTGINC